MIGGRINPVYAMPLVDQTVELKVLYQPIATESTEMLVSLRSMSCFSRSLGILVRKCLHCPGVCGYCGKQQDCVLDQVTLLRQIQTASRPHGYPSVRTVAALEVVLTVMVTLLSVDCVGVTDARKARLSVPWNQFFSVH